MPGYMYRERARPYLNVPVVPAWVDEMIDREPVEPEGKKVAVCGTTGGAYKHKRLGEKMCDPCRAALRAYERSTRRVRRPRTPEQREMENLRDRERRAAARERLTRV